MVYCDNHKCRYHRRGACLNMRLVIASEHCVCFGRAGVQRNTNETDLNHRPVKHTQRNRVLKLLDIVKQDEFFTP